MNRGVRTSNLHGEMQGRVWGAQAPLASSVTALQESPTSTFNKTPSPGHEKQTGAEGKQSAGADSLIMMVECETRGRGWGRGR